METINDVHLQFAAYFHAKEIAPYLYLLSQMMEEGSTCLYVAGIEKEKKDNFPFDLDQYEVSAIAGSPLVNRGEAMSDRPFVWDRDRLYLQRYFRYEIGLIAKIKEIGGRWQW